MMNTQAAYEATDALVYPVGGDNRQDRLDAYYNEQQRIALGFKEWLAAEYAADLTWGVRDLVWDKANHMSADNFSEIENKYIDFASLSRAIVQDVKDSLGID